MQPTTPTSSLSLDPALIADLASVREVLATVPDPRQARGRRYSLPALLLLVVAGLLCQVTGLRAIARWGKLRAPLLAPALGIPRGTMPSPATLARVLQHLDAQDLDERLTLWLRTHTPLAPGEGIAVDGKTLRGVPDGLHLLAAYAHQAQVVVAQEAVASKENEITAAPRVLAHVPVGGQVVTGDAELAQRELSRQVLEQGGDYFWVVKDNQPTLRADIALLFDEPPPGEEFAMVHQDHRHGGRQERRRLWASAALQDYLPWPGVRQVCKVERTVTCRSKVRQEVVYGVTSLSPERATARRLLGLSRGHWGIENGLHWVRDVIYGEDRCRIQRGQAPRVWASLRNLALGVLRRANVSAITEALERHAAYPHQALALLGVHAPGL
jgi:predicted transposase YbfD/YdcC